MNVTTKTIGPWQKKPWVKALQKQLTQAELFLVGGAVRDAFLGRPTVDFDLVIRGVAKPTVETFLKKYGQVNFVGRRFGVYKFTPRGEKKSLDIALPRTEHSNKHTGARTDFVIKSDHRLAITDDLSRRDFTINAMALRINDGVLFDPHGGKRDIAKKIIRTVGTPQVRFAEDYSRMLRAVRFANQLEFSIEPKTKKVIAQLASRLNKKVAGEFIVPREVVASELVKTLAQNPRRGVTLLDTIGLLAVLMPELLKMKRCPQPKNFHAEGDVWKHTMLLLKELDGRRLKTEFPSTTVSNELIWATLFHDLGKPYTLRRGDRLHFNNHDNVSAEKFHEIATRLKLNAAGLDITTVEQLISKHMLAVQAKHQQLKPTTLERYFFNQAFPGQDLLRLIYTDSLATITPEGKPTTNAYKALKKQLHRLNKKSTTATALPKPLITGTDLLKTLRLTPGPKIGQLLERARELQLAGAVKTKAQVLALLKKEL